MIDSAEGTFLVLEDGAIHRRTPGKPTAMSSNSSAMPSISRRSPRAVRPLSIARRRDRSPTSGTRTPRTSSSGSKARAASPRNCTAGSRCRFTCWPSSHCLRRPCEPRTTREGRGLALAGTAPFIIFLQVTSFGLINQVRSEPALIPVVYLVPILFILGAMASLSGRFKPRMPEAIRIRIDRLAQRVARATVN